MKKLSFLLVISLGIGIMSYGQSKPDVPKAEDKKLKVELYSLEWESRFNWLQYAMMQLKKSNGPANEILPLCDSLQKFSNELVAQLQPQFLAQAKQDSINHKK